MRIVVPLLIVAVTTCCYADEPKPTILASLRDCVVVPLDTIQVPARKSGVLVKLFCIEGQSVSKEELLAQISTDEMESRRRVADYDLQLAKFEATNKTRVKAAELKAAVAQTEYEMNVELAKFEAVPKLELIKSKLAMENAVLEGELSNKELEKAQLTAKQKEEQLRLVDIEIAERRIVAPRTGVVSELYRRQGEWVDPGEPVARLVRMDRLSVGARLNIASYSPVGLKNSEASIRYLFGPNGKEEHISASINYVSPEIEPNGDFRIAVEFDNLAPEDSHSPWLLHPGMLVKLVIYKRSVENSASSTNK